MCRPESQLDYIGQYRPHHVPLPAWSEYVSEAVWLAAYFKALTAT